MSDFRVSDGARVIAPTGGKITCVRHDGTQLEHPDADHPDYKGMVHATYVGESVDPFMFRLPDGTQERLSPKIEACMRHQTHALLYCDGYVAVTTYDACYAMWIVKTGLVEGGSLWDRGTWQLSPESIERCLSFRNR